MITGKRRGIIAGKAAVFGSDLLFQNPELLCSINAHLALASEQYNYLRIKGRTKVISLLLDPRRPLLNSTISNVIKARRCVRT
jgi:hypothetical protein